MKKVLILTVIAILALGVMVLASNAVGNSDAVGNNNLAYSGTLNVTIDQWINMSVTPTSVEIRDDGYSWQPVAKFTIQTNGGYKIFVTDVTSDMNSGSGLAGGVHAARIGFYNNFSSYIQGVGLSIHDPRADALRAATATVVGGGTTSTPPGQYYAFGPYTHSASNWGNAHNNSFYNLFKPGGPHTYELSFRFYIYSNLWNGTYQVPFQIWVIPSANFSALGFSR